MTYENTLSTRGENKVPTHPLKWQPEMQRREVLARIKLVSKVRYLVLFGSRDRVCYDPACVTGHGTVQTATRESMEHGRWDRTYLTSLGEVETPTLMVDAPLSRTMTGARLIANWSD
jgi:hypothetical protein